MKKIILLCLYLSSTIFGLAQSEKYFETFHNASLESEECDRIIKTNIGYLAVGGRTTLARTNDPWDGLILRLDESGQVVWDTTLVQPSHHQFFTDIEATLDGHYILVGICNDRDVGLSRGHLTKINEWGHVLWSKRIGTLTNTHWVSLPVVAATPDGGFIAVGQRAEVPRGGALSPYLVKVDAEGNMEWDKRYTKYDDTSTRFSGWSSVLPMPEGGYYVGGITNAERESSDALVARLDAQGEILWDSVYTHIGLFDAVFDMAWSSDDHLLLTGDGSDAEHIAWYTGTAFVIKMDTLGNIIWHTDQLALQRGGTGIQQISDGNIIITGDTDELPTGLDGHLSKLDLHTGDILWRRLYVHEEDRYVRGVTETPDRGFFICGRTFEFPEEVGGSGDDVYLLKVNCMGLLFLPQASFDYAGDAQTLHLHNTSQFVYPDSIDGGHFSWDFGDGQTSTEVSPTHTYEQGGTYTVQLKGMVCTDTSIVAQTISVALVGIEEQTGFESLSPYPNPAKEIVYIPYTCTANSQLHIYTAIGEFVQTMAVAKGKHTLSLPTIHFPAGIYLYEWERDGQKIEGKKFAVVK